MDAWSTEEKLDALAPLCPITTLIPCYGAANKLRVCLDSLATYGPAAGTIIVLDDGTPNDTVRTACGDVQKDFASLQYIRREVNGGFVSTCNWGRHEFWDGHSDLLLLNSDTEVTAGSLQEMQRVLYLCEKHAVVTPRSNSATIFSIPAVGERLARTLSFQLWTRMRPLLPRYNVMPTAVGFCMLIKSEVLRRFDLFDEIYSPGYNEENDFVCRINRFGYSAVAANRAYVFHDERSSFGVQRESLEEVNGATLLKRFPEYSRKVRDYLRFEIDPVEHFACLYEPHRPRILYDLFHLPAAYNGTAEFGLTLLREVSYRIEPDADLYVGIGREALAFFASDLRGHKFFMDPPEATDVFDLVFKPSQVFNWAAYERMIRLAPRIGYTLQDIIAVRCGYLNSPHQETIFRQAAQLSDRVFAISRASHSDFEAFFGITVPMKIIYHGSDFGLMADDRESGEQILIVGNDVYFHKGMEDAVERLAAEWSVVVLGGYHSEPAEASTNVRRLRSGNLPRQYLRQLFLKARIVVYPSHYEGFGLPVLDALALGKTVIVLNTAVNRELLELTNNPKLHIVDSAQELSLRVRHLLAQTANGPTPPIPDWRTAGQEYGEILRQMLCQDIDLRKVRARWDLLRSVNCMSAV